MTSLHHPSADSGRSCTGVVAAWIGELQASHCDLRPTFVSVSETSGEIGAPIQIKCIGYRASELKSMKISADVRQLYGSPLRNTNYHPTKNVC